MEITAPQKFIRLLSRPAAVLLAALMVAPWSVRAQVSTDIRLNQIGFYPQQQKIAVVKNAMGSTFAVVNAASGDTAFRGSLSSPQIWTYSDESVSKADFSGLAVPGDYFIFVPGMGISSPFTVKTRVHQPLAAASLKAYYYQRASQRLTIDCANIWARPAGHPDTSVIIHPSAASVRRPAGTRIAAPRGWYDAGDYNKYIVNSGISTYTLLAAYERFPEYCGKLKDNIPENGNTIPDILDEALWNIRWMLAMQDPDDGGVYSKLTNPDFDGWIMPSAAVQPRYVVMKSTAAALDFAAVMAQSSRVFSAFSSELPGLSDTCLRASLAAWKWARQNPAVYYNQAQMNSQFIPAINTGEYGDSNVQDEFDWAASELFVATARDSFLTAANPLRTLTASLPSWPSVRALGLYTLAHYRSLYAGIVDTNGARGRILSLANFYRNAAASSPYGVVMGAQPGDFVWGSNGVAANEGMLLLCAYQMTGDQGFLSAAISNLDYLLGRNGPGYCFVTGYGSQSPMHIHHRQSQSDNIAPPVPGLLAGGPNPGREDGVTYPSTKPALAYTDNVNSYASNEIAINWNAPLVFLAIGIEALTSPDGLPLSAVPELKPPAAPQKYGILSNYPNPFNPGTTISYVLPERCNVVVEIYSILGNRIAILVHSEQEAGRRDVAWHSNDSSGVYFCRLNASSLADPARHYTDVKKLLLQK